MRAYNEQDNIERVVKHLTENYPEYDYVVINDGSMDKTSEICHSNHYNIIDLPVNLGLAGGFQTGMKYDIVIASRFVEEKKPATARMIGSRLITTAIRLTSGAKIMDPTSGMRMYNKKLIEVLANNINFGPEPDTVSYLIKMGAKVAEIQAKMDERIAGQSYLNAVNAAKYMARMLISILLIQNFRNKKKVDFTK